MRLQFVIIITLILSVIAPATPANADEVVLISGEHFKSHKVWEENGKIRFNMHGLVVSVDKSDVAAVIRSDGSTTNIAQPAPDASSRPDPTQSPATSSQHLQKPNPPTNQPPPSSPSPAQPSPENKSRKGKISGIGFAGISWHMRPDELSGLKKIKTEPIYGGVDQYWRPDGSMTLGNVLLDGLVFGFWRNRLYSIMMWVEGEPAYRRLQKVVFKLYGDGQKSKNRQEQYIWVKDQTTDRLLEFDKERNIGIFWLRSRELDEHIKQIYPET